jgi:excisionase family DNA binding protein
MPPRAFTENPSASSEGNVPSSAGDKLRSDQVSVTLSDPAGGTGTSPRDQRRARRISEDVPIRTSQAPLLTVHDVALRLNLSPRTVWRIPKKELPRIKLGRATRFTEDDVQAYIDRHRI